MVLSGLRGARNGFDSRGRRRFGCPFGPVGVLPAMVAGDVLAVGRELLALDPAVAREFGAPFMASGSRTGARERMGWGLIVPLRWTEDRQSRRD
jgi:hypothetical protein